MIAHFNQEFPVTDPFARPIPRPVLEKLARAANLRYKAETGKYLQKMEICVEKLVVIVDGTIEYKFEELYDCY